MRKPFLQFSGFLVLVIFWSSPILAQISQHHSINASGMTWSQGIGSISFTVGEIVIPLAEDSLGNAIAGGLTSSSSIEITQVESIDVSEIDLSVYPNPTSDLINLQVNFSNFDKFKICIHDINGAEKFTGQYYGLKNTIGINMHSFAAGAYMLYILNPSDQTIGSFRIIKN